MALVIREDDVRNLLSMRDTVDVLEKAFGALAAGLAQNQPRSRIEMSNGVLHTLGAAFPQLDVLGLKTYTAFREGVRFIVLLFSAQDGCLLSIIEADWLGCMRTGATSGVATNYLARDDARVVGMIGAGRQAVTQLMGVCAVRPVTTAFVYSRHFRDCAIFCDEMARLLSINVMPVNDAREAVEAADILITATPARDPVLFGEWLKPGCHINAIGSNWEDRREIDLSTLKRSYLIVTDSLKQARLEAGDFIIPEADGLFEWERVYELADVVNANGPRRSSPQDITLYKGLGIGLEDIATAALVYKLAQERGLGENLDILA